jgi:hypothetical protein
MDNIDFGSESERSLLLRSNPGLLSRVAKRIGMSTAAVSRTFHGVTKETNPRIVRALESTIAGLRRRNEVK